MILPKWFRVLIASFCIFGVGILFFGANNSNTVNLREVDASIGLIRRPKSRNIIDSAKYFFRPVKTEAFVVAIGADAPRIIEKIIRIAIAAAISAIIGFIVKKISGFFEDIIDKIGMWIGVSTGLKDSLGSFNAAIGMKAYQVSECLIESSDSVIRKMFAGTDMTKNETAKQIAIGAGLSAEAGGIEVDTVKNSKDACKNNSTEGIQSSKSQRYQQLKNAISELRISQLITTSQKGNFEGAVDEENADTFKEDTGDATSNEVPDGQSQETLNATKSVEQNEALKQQIKESAEALVCAEDGSAPEEPVSRSANFFPPSSSNAVLPSCGLTENTARVESTLLEMAAKDEEVRKSVEENLDKQAPSDCKIGYLDDGFSGDTAQLPSFSLEGGNSAGIAAGSIDLSAATISASNKIDTKTYNKEQCESQNRLPSLQDSAAATSSGNSAGTEEAVGTVVTLRSIIEQITGQLKDQILNKIFDFFTAAATSLISKIGNSYIVQSITTATGVNSNSAQNSLSQITEEYLNSQRDGI